MSRALGTFVHGHPSFKQSKAPGAPLKTVAVDSIMDEPMRGSAADQQVQGRQSGWEMPAAIKAVGPIANPEVQWVCGWCFCCGKEKKERMRKGGNTGLEVQRNEQIKYLHGWGGQQSL